eukprot:TRINITY_DN7810_c0_g1_i2.p1 TRINITY_DN7810_c0_g1~~TRINITY_DN7810_c0_g1_i2.p1  ORF type:complete len:123 (+),score=28.14 TRINITY_DN7810_c0_g1_i2:139-507(+)
MGSLMAGWSSSALSSSKLGKNKSLTKEEIDAFWRSKRQAQEEHARAASAALSSSSSSSESVGEGSSLSTEEKDAVKDFTAWWTKSKWAFLNEPPVKAMEGPSYKYAAQYHVANKAVSDIDVK